MRRFFSTWRVLHHDNPLVHGLPKRGEPPVMPRRGLPPKRSIPHVKKVLAIASGKGGVGKSTVAGSSSLHLYPIWSNHFPSEPRLFPRFPPARTRGCA
jgi:NUBPL iron-transfer P-loop NTPase